MKVNLNLKNNFIEDVDLKAQIIMNKHSVIVDVLDYSFSDGGVVNILSIDKVLYMVHISNVTMYAENVSLDK